jgi:fatty-acyl-CoA synthase
MAALVTEQGIDLPAFRKHLMSRLPAYARPLFLRIRDDIEVTGTFKYSKTDLMREGYDPAATTDAIYFDNPETEAFIQLDKMLYDRIQVGQICL